MTFTWRRLAIVLEDGELDWVSIAIEKNEKQSSPLLVWTAKMQTTIL